MNMLSRSIIFKRGAHSLRDLIPPNIGLAARKIENAPASVVAEADASATASEGASELTSKDFDRLVTFYKRIPKGPGPVTNPNSYRAKYLDSGSFTPVIQIIAAFLVGGYTIHHFMHISMDQNSRFAGRLRGVGNQDEVDEFGRARRQKSYNNKPYSRPFKPNNNRNNSNGYRNNYNRNNSNSQNKPEKDLVLERITTSIVKLGDDSKDSGNFEEMCDSILSDYNSNEAYAAEIKKYIIYSVKELVYKHKVYITLIGLINQKNSDLGLVLFNEIFNELKKAINEFDWRLIRILLRTIGGFVETNMLAPESFIQILNNFLEPIYSNSTISFKSSCLVWVVGTTICFTGNAILGKNLDSELENILQAIDQYCSGVTEEPVLNRITNPIQNLNHKTFSFLRSTLGNMYNSSFQNNLIVNTCEIYKDNFASATTHQLPELDFSLIQSNIDTAIKGSKAGKRFGFYAPCGYLEFLLSDSDSEEISPEKFLMYEMISDLMAVLSVNRKAAATLLHTVDCLNKDTIFSKVCSPKIKQESPDDISEDDQNLNLNLEKMVVTVIFSQLFDLPFNSVPPVYFSSLAVELCLQHEMYKEYIETALNKLFECTLDPECVDRLADFHSFYVSNNNYVYTYLETSDKDILKASIKKQIRLSYYDYIKAIVYDKMPEIVPESKPSHKFKYVISEIDEETKNVSIAVGKCMKANGSAEMIINILKEHYQGPDSGYLKLEMLIEHMLLSGSKGFSHMIGSIEKYSSVVEVVCQEIHDGNQKQFISNIISRFWNGNPQFLSITIDKYLNYKIIDPISIINTMMTDTFEFLFFEKWDIIINLVNKLELRINQLNYRISHSQQSNEIEMLKELLVGLELDMQQAIIQIFEKFAMLFVLLQSLEISESDKRQQEESLVGRFIEFNRRYCHHIKKTSSELEGILSNSGEILRTVFEVTKRYF
ncbi:Nuclear cap-binding protein subunit 1 [Smittium culicis]|uniref:Nuclear cap-binding protein subunit 1 n=1 Tax=Smittium culicis TaxID=133412 RepID=A0A1R1Y852_9FUNG|nr:Nuclear cap-binding protein subunit 1 [Smittium culicis]